MLAGLGKAARDCADKVGKQHGAVEVFWRGKASSSFTSPTMYVDDGAASPAEPDHAIGHGVFVEPDKLERQADQFANLGDELHQQLGRGEVRRPMLGTSPPALWMATRLAELAGPDGAPNALRQWANGLARLGQMP